MTDPSPDGGDSDDGDGIVLRHSGPSIYDTDSSSTSAVLLRRSRSLSLRQPGLHPFQSDDSRTMAPSDVVTAKAAYMLYLCHFLSTWNARVYEFAAVLFTASAFPENLLASSIFGMTMSLSILCFASLLGTWVDRAPSRLATLCTTIIANRISVIAACLGWLIIVGNSVNGDGKEAKPVESSATFWLSTKRVIFVVITIFGVIERLSRTANLISIERDWVPTLAPTTGMAGDANDKFGLTQLNAVMSRIDLVCKLISPIAISSFVSAVGSMKIVAGVLLVWNALSLAPEIATARIVWNLSSRLQVGKELLEDNLITSSVWKWTIVDKDIPVWKHLALRCCETFGTAVFCIQIWLQDYKENLSIYFTYRVWIPSLALSILHFSVLNYSATLTVYLLSSGFSINIITMARAFSSVAEISSTFFYPFGVRFYGRRYENTTHLGPIYNGVEQDEDSTELLESHNLEDDSVEGHKTVFGPGVDMGVAILGLWALIQMGLCLVPAVFALWTLSVPRDPSSPPPTHSKFITIILLTTIPLSRFGRWTNHLNTQQLTQTLVPPSHRSGFAGAEMGFVSLFGMGHWVVTATWSKHEEFKWLALGSVVAVSMSAGSYWGWLRRETEDRGRRR